MFGNKQVIRTHRGISVTRAFVNTLVGIREFAFPKAKEGDSARQLELAVMPAVIRDRIISQEQDKTNAEEKFRADAVISLLDHITLAEGNLTSEISRIEDVLLSYKKDLANLQDARSHGNKTSNYLPLLKYVTDESILATAGITEEMTTIPVEVTKGAKPLPVERRKAVKKPIAAVPAVKKLAAYNAEVIARIATIAKEADLRTAAVKKTA